jgi:hypothetical protein
MGAHRQAQLQVRRGELLARSRMLRERLAAETLPLQSTLSLADTARDRLRWLMAHPQWVAAIVAIPILLRPRRAVAWALKLWWSWRMIGRLRGLLPLQPTSRP